jgi:modulator of FtsH protease
VEADRADAYRPDAWHDLAVAAVGATAALTGLLFVAVSINLDRILSFPWLPRRAGATLVLLVALLVAGVFVLVPGQPLPVLAAELGATGLVLVATGAAELVRVRGEEDRPRGRRVGRAVIVLLPAGALLAAAGSLALGGGGGLYWLAGAVVGGIAAACANAWVLLVEIQR